MARIQLLLPDEDRDRFLHEARKEGISLSEWLRLAARERADRRQRHARFVRAEEVAAFFERCDVADSPDTEPDWEDHLAVIEESRRQGASGT